jgi:Bax protein
MRLFFRCDFLSGIILVFCLSNCEWSPQYQVKKEIVHLKSTDQIVLINKPIVNPIVYTHISGFEKLPADEAKEKFISVVLPAVLLIRFEIEQNRKRVDKLGRKIQWSTTDSLFYHKLRLQYRAKDLRDLFLRMKPLPVSIVLAQAAIESGWGKSRIFVKANNVFGVWSFNAHEPRIAALVKRGNKRIYLKMFTNISYSVANYFQILGRSKSFEQLRSELATTNDPMVIVPYLKNYSERRTAYTRQLKSLIEKNNLTKYDHYILDPASIVVRE